MYVVINSQCAAVPDGAEPLTSEGNALLHVLICLGYQATNPPYADLLRQIHHLDGDWLVLSPIHWQATHNDALIVALGKDLELQDIEAKSWFDSFADYLAADGMILYYHDAETWLLSTQQHHSLHAKPVHQLINQSLMPELAQLDDSLYWQKFITESQMFFASKPNHSALNGLWPWGNGKLGAKKEVAICSDEHFLAAAKICSSRVSLYNPSIKLNEYQLLLINDLTTLSLSHQEELKKTPRDWYWNNTAYSSNKGNWLARFWRKLIHAH